MALDFWWLGFKKELEGYGTGDLGRVIAAMNAKVRVPAGCSGGLFGFRGLTRFCTGSCCRRYVASEGEG